ncbi:MAG: acyloxyacyl hydrolase [Bacteroidia bacterium]
MRFRLSLFLFFLLSQFSLFAQGEAWGLEPFIGYHYASNLIEKTKQSMNGICGGIDLKYSLNHRISRESKELYHHPDLQLHLRICRLNNTDTFGYSLALFPQVEIPIFKNNRIALAAKMGYGINYNSKEFNTYTNFDNRAISSPINFALDAGLLVQFKLNNKNEIGFSSGLYHVSNGSLKMPNGGMNVIYTGINYQYLLKNSLESKYQKIKKTKGFDSHQTYQIYTAIGRRELGYFNATKSFWTATFSQQWCRKISPLYRIGINSDFFYDKSPVYWNDMNRTDQSISFKEKIHAALGLYQQFDLGKFYLPFSANYYVNKVAKPFYIKFGLGYHINKNLFIGGFFKGGIINASKLESDFMEWSIGYSFLNH